MTQFGFINWDRVPVFRRLYSEFGDTIPKIPWDTIPIYEAKSGYVPEFSGHVPKLLRSYLIGLCVVLAFGIPAICLGIASEADSGDPPDVLSQLRKAKEFYRGVDDYRCVFIKQERLEEKLKEPETILFKFQKPFRIYMKWVEEPNKGRELLFVPGKYDDKLKVHIGGILNLILPSITIAPDNPMVMSHTRHPITNAGMGNLIDSLIDQFELAKKQGDLSVIAHGTEEIEGVECLKIERVLPKDKGYYCHRLLLYLYPENYMPARVMIYDWNDKLIENYTFTRMQWNVGLTDKDFDSRNKEYSFGMF